MTGTALAPFAQAIATKIGEDTYGKIKKLLTRRKVVPPPEGGPIILADPAAAIALEIPAKLDNKDAYTLASVRMPSAAGSQWILVRYDSQSRTWTAVPIAQPPSGAIEIDKE